MLKKVNILLEKVEGILNNQKQISFLKGENFNVFSVINVEAKEDGTHSRIIRELLDPYGSHQMGDVFLKHFIEIINKIISKTNRNFSPIKLETETCQVYREFTIGKIDLNNSTGGRIDILIKDIKGIKLAIENKIYAKDQQAQIKRYYNYVQPKGYVLYLTLFGKGASDYSLKNLETNLDYLVISYQKDILSWLELCLKEVTNVPILRETINQYINLVKKLTHQLSDKKMEDQLVKAITANYQEAQLITRNIQKAEVSIIRELFKDVEIICMELLNNKEEWVYKTDENLNEKYSGFKISNINWPKAVEVKIEPNGKNFFEANSCVLGIIAHKLSVDRKKIKEAIISPSIIEGVYFETEGWPIAIMANNLCINSDKKRLNLFDSSKRKIIAKNIAERLVDYCILNKQSLKELN